MCRLRAGLHANVPYDGLRRQRVLLVLADRLKETLRPGIYVAKEGGVISVDRVKASSELGSVKDI